MKSNKKVNILVFCLILFSLVITSFVVLKIFQSQSRLKEHNDVKCLNEMLDIAIGLQLFIETLPQNQLPEILVFSHTNSEIIISNRQLYHELVENDKDNELLPSASKQKYNWLKNREFVDDDGNPYKIHIKIGNLKEKNKIIIFSGRKDKYGNILKKERDLYFDVLLPKKSSEKIEQPTPSTNTKP